MKRFVRWLKGDSAAQLQYKDDDVSGWQNYTSHPHYGVVREYPDADGSKGFKMFQHLLGQGYQALDPDGNEVE